MNKPMMSWSDRFALIDHYAPSDDQVCAVFGLSQEELDTARSLKAAGMVKSSAALDVSKYAEVFATGKWDSVAPQFTASFQRPETASRSPKLPQKRGRKGDKIQQALQSVPTVQIPVEAFIKEHGVSLAVLRQSKRFMSKMDPEMQQQIGRVNVRQDKTTRTLMIWRESNS